MGGRQARRPRTAEHPPERPVLRRQAGRRAARLDRARPLRRAAGRRAAAPAGEPHHDDEHGQGADAALRLPAARREGGHRPHRRRPRDRPHARVLRRGSSPTARPAAPWPTGSASARRRTSTPTRRSTRPCWTATSPRLRGRAPPRDGLRGLHGGLARVRAERPARRVRRGLPEPPRAGVQPHALHRLERLGRHAEGRAPARHPLRHELLLQGPGRLGRRERPGPDDGLRLPAALRRSRRLDDRRLPGDDAGHRRDGRRHPDDGPDQRAARQRARRRRATTASSPSSSTATSATTSGSPTSSPRRATAASRSSPPRRCSTGSTAATARRSTASTYSGGQLQFTLRKSPKARGLEAMVPFSSGTGPLVAADARRRPGLLGEADDQGRRVRRVRRRRRRLHRALRDRHDGAGDHRRWPRRPTARATPR